MGYMQQNVAPFLQVCFNWLAQTWSFLSNVTILGYGNSVSWLDLIFGSFAVLLIIDIFILRGGKDDDD